MPVEATLQVVGQDRIYAIGDIAYPEDQKSETYRVLIAPAKPHGILAATNTMNGINDLPLKPFYKGCLISVSQSP